MTSSSSVSQKHLEFVELLAEFGSCTADHRQGRHRLDPEQDVEATGIAIPGSWDTFQFDADVARVYLSLIREWKERE